jgi:DNA-binding NarL/FixJ family response regulator
VLLVDDQALVRHGFRLILGTEPDIDVVGEAEDGRQAVDAVRRHRPDVALIDIRMPVLDGLAATRAILADPDNRSRVLILTTFDHDEYVFEALRAGASGFLLKTATPDELVTAVRVVARGDALLSPSVTRQVVEQFARLATPPPPPELDQLTARELDVLGLVSRGMSNAEAAAALHLSEATIKTHISGMLTKLGLRDRVQAVVFSYEHGLTRRGL